MSDISPPKKTPSVLALKPGNQRPFAETPWGGEKLVKKYKSTVNGPRVGEIWDVSFDTRLPSLSADGTPALATVVQDPSHWRGSDDLDGPGWLLLKWIDTADALSVQIHPPDDYARLKATECGKPECWYVVDAQPGAGLFIGLNEDCTEENMRRAIASGADVSQLLHYQPVSPGDFFVIEPGTPHALGPGLVLLEPQRLQRGKHGVTYRYWDWGRRYDKNGNRDDAGAARTLHVDDAIAVTEWTRPRGQNALQRIMATAGPATPTGSAQITSLAGHDGPVCSDDFEVWRLEGKGEITLPDNGRLTSLTLIDGAVEIVGAGTNIQRGHSALLAANRGALTVRLHGAHALLAAVT